MLDCRLNEALTKKSQTDYIKRSRTRGSLDNDGSLALVEDAAATHSSSVGP